ncbi:MAG: MarR family transcriptional regulator, partial [Actinomycetota bacterium]
MTDLSAAPADDAVSRIEAGLARLLRTTLVRLHERAGAEAGVTIERAGYWLLASLADRGPLRLSDLAQAMALD